MIFCCCCCFDKSKMFTIDCTTVTKCSHCKKNVDTKCISVHEKRCRDRPIKCPECSQIFAFQKWFDHECQVVDAKGNYFIYKNSTFLCFIIILCTESHITIFFFYNMQEKCSLVFDSYLILLIYLAILSCSFWCVLYWYIVKFVVFHPDWAETTMMYLRIWCIINNYR